MDKEDFLDEEREAPNCQTRLFHYLFPNKVDGDGKKAFKYDIESPLIAASRLTHSVVPATIAMREFWILYGIHISLAILYSTGKFPAKELGFYLEWNDLKTIGALVTFCQVFYTTQCYTRYRKLYRTSKGLFAKVIRLFLEMRIYMADTCPTHCKLSSRYILSSIYLFFVSLNAGAFSDETGTKGMVNFLVRPDEYEHLKKFHPHDRFCVTLHWAVIIVNFGCKKYKIPANIQKSFGDKCTDIWKDMRYIGDYLALSIPFGYYHVLNLMVLVNLVLLAYAMGVYASLLSSVVYFFCILIFLGMMELASELTDPFGDDEVDFPLADWLLELMETSEFVLEHTTVGNADNAWERLVEKEIGAGFFPNEVSPSWRRAGATTPQSQPWSMTWQNVAAREDPNEQALGSGTPKSQRNMAVAAGEQRGARGNSPFGRGGARGSPGARGGRSPGMRGLPGVAGAGGAGVPLGPFGTEASAQPGATSARSASPPVSAQGTTSARSASPRRSGSAAPTGSARRQLKKDREIAKQDDDEEEAPDHNEPTHE